MKNRDRVESLRQISAIRNLQRIAAEGRAARAASAVREKEAAKLESERVREQAAAAWLDVVSAPSLRLDMSHLWSRELGRREQAVRHASASVDTAASELERRTKAWHGARTQCDAAQDMFERALKDQMRRREEDALQDASDRHAQLAWRP